MAVTKPKAPSPEVLQSYTRPFRVDGTKHFDLSAHHPAQKGDLHKQSAHKLIAENSRRLSYLQEKLYAQDRWSLLLIFQGMDAAGKDSAIKHVMSGVNPQGCQVHSFKTPSPMELDHDFMWRAYTRLPERGQIGIFNRSYYEECLIVRVHPEMLEQEKIPRKLVTKNIWRERFEDMVAFERYLARNGTIVLKFFLNISKEEQRQRFLARLDEPTKNWKFSMTDVAERERWDDYQRAYEDMIRQTATSSAPWHVVPADYKWFGRVVIGCAIVNALEQLDLHFPKVGKDDLKEFGEVRRALEAQAPAEKAAKPEGAEARGNGKREAEAAKAGNGNGRSGNGGRAKPAKTAKVAKPDAGTVPADAAPAPSRSAKSKVAVPDEAK